jgi:hypothetical protein
LARPSVDAPRILAMRPDERAVLEPAIRRVTEQAANADAIVDEGMARPSFDATRIRGCGRTGAWSSDAQSVV